MAPLADEIDSVRVIGIFTCFVVPETGFECSVSGYMVACFEVDERASVRRGRKPRKDGLPVLLRLDRDKEPILATAGLAIDSDEVSVNAGLRDPEGDTGVGESRGLPSPTAGLFLWSDDDVS